jgi:hypothetical protein
MDGKQERCGKGGTDSAEEIAGHVKDKRGIEGVVHEIGQMEEARVQAEETVVEVKAEGP